MMALHPRRLVVRIYLVGLLQIAFISISFSLLRTYVLESPWKTSILKRTSYLVSKVAEHRGHPEELRHEAMRIGEDLGAALSLYAPDGTLLSSSSQPPLPPLRPRDLSRLSRERAFTLDTPLSAAVAVMEGGQLVAYGVFAQAPPPVPFSHTALSITIAIVCLAIGSQLFARALGRPLERLVKVARAFGSGDLSVRARLTRSDEIDEIGALGRAFDEMADRVTNLLRAQKELLANISHELRTPLSRIRVALDLAAESDVEGRSESLGEIAEDLTELERLLEDVLTAARLDLQNRRAGGPEPPLHLQPVDAAALLEKAVSRFRTIHPSRPLRIETCGPLPSVLGDAPLLRRVIGNLLDNAHKYSELACTVVLRARGADGALLIEVIDQGIGIDEADLPHLFTPFFRSDRSRARRTGGVGLGLALARRVVTAHGGTISVSSKAGQGTTVTVLVPKCPGELHSTS